MAISFTRPDPSSPSAVAAAAFTTSRKGFEQAEVREFLRLVAAELARLQEREKFLERELRSAQRGAAMPSVPLDEELVTRMLGEEAARVLQSARDAAAQIRNRAEDGAARLLREATDEAQRLRTEAELEAARRRNDASADAESELERATQQGREMVNEARAYRERVLSELARRRELARQQIEQLIHGRDRLLQAFERSRAVAVDVMAELTPLAEPTEYVDLSPTTGPVPIIVPRRPLHVAGTAPMRDEQRGADTDAGAATDRTEPVRLDHPSVGGEPDAVHLELVSDASASDAVVLEIAGAGQDGEGADDADPAGPDEGVASVIELFTSADDEPPVEDPADAAVGASGDEADDVAGADVTGDVPAEDVPASAGEGAAECEGAPDETTPIELAVEHDATSAMSRGTVDDLFARLRASRTEHVAQRVVESAAAPTPLPVEDHRGDDAVGEPPIDATGSAEATPGATSTEPPARPDDSVFLATPDAPTASAPTDDTPFARRDAALTPVIVAAARKLKRVLADEQNEVLHALRRRDPVRALDALVPPESEHVARYVVAIDGELADAAIAGAASMGATATSAKRDLKKANATAPAQATLAADLVGPLRVRLGRCVADADGDNAELSNLVRVLYREWKTQRIDEHLDDIVRAAFGRGALAVTSDGSPIRWIVDPKGPACPDAEDNALAGVVRAGEQFPTDHVCAPAHRGCTCMIARATE